MPRPTLKVFKKRKLGFTGVRRQSKCDTTGSQEEVIPSTSSREDQSPRPTSTSDKKESSSKRKVGPNINSYELFVGENADNVFDLINLHNLETLIKNIAVCSKCHNSLSVISSNRKGLSCTVSIVCSSCKFTVSENNCKSLASGPSELNVRLAYAFRCIGKGEQAARCVCAMMNMPQPPEFKLYKDILCKAAEDVCKDSMSEAAREAVAENMAENKNEITAIFDGTWQRRGHRSLNGVVTAISGDTGKVVDCRVLTKYCRCKDRLKNKHEEKCIANYFGSSGGMEAQGVVEMFKKSEETHGIKYKYYLGDGDSSSFPTVVAAKPYGQDFVIEKKECIGHVQKRMGSRLMALKKRMGKNELSDGKTIGGRGRLTEVAITKIQEYYGQAIRRNCSSLEKMKTAVWAEFFHILASDATPEHHNLCPKAPDTWCKYQQSIINCEPYDHSKHFHLPEAVMTTIKPIFQNLSNPDLLRGCLHGATQNPCESLNHIIWSRIPKTTFVMKQTLETGVFEAVASFNKGNIIKCELLHKLGIVPGSNCIKYLKSMDLMRIKKAEKDFLEYEKRCRKMNALAKRRLDDAFEEQEDPDNPSYAPGHY